MATPCFNCPLPFALDEGVVCTSSFSDDHFLTVRNRLDLNPQSNSQWVLCLVKFKDGQPTGLMSEDNCIVMNSHSA